MGIRSNYVLCAIVGTIARPSTTFRTMFHAPDGYRASSVAIFAAVCLVSALPSTSVWLESDSGIFNGFGNVVLAYAKSFISTVLPNFFIIAAIFWVGTRYGEKLKFRDMFPVLSYCLIPIAVGAAATLIGMHLFDPLAFMHDDIQDADAGVSPSYALDFTGGTIIYMAQGAFALFFMAWAGVLLVKAIKISHGFGTGKTVGVLALAIALTYAFTIAFGILQTLFLELVWPGLQEQVVATSSCCRTSIMF